MKRVGLVTAAFVAAVAIWAWSLPASRLHLESWNDGTVRGVMHVHTRRSDGMGTPETVAAAAARAGLQFVVLTDHGDATRKPDPPVYLSGVLVLDGVEISTRGGHYIAIGLPQSPYPLAGDPSEVVADVRRMGAFGIAAHPDSPKSELHWMDWSLPFDAVELINPDTAWRLRATTEGADGKWRLLHSLFAYPTRSAEVIANLLTDNSTVRNAWLLASSSRRIVGLAGADAHAKLQVVERDPGDNSLSVSLPSYDASFASLSVHVRTRGPLTGDAAGDAAMLLAGLRAGAAFVAVDGWAEPAALDFTATSGSARASMGDAIAGDGAVMLHVKSNAPPGFQTRLSRGTDVIAERVEAEFDLPAPGAGQYRVDVVRPGKPGPAWVTSNPIYVGDYPQEHADVKAVPGATVRTLFNGRSVDGWSHEQDRASVAAIDVAPFVDGARLRLRYGLAAGADVGQFVALAVATEHGVDDAAGVAFRVRSDLELRLAIQVRAEVPGAAPERWERSVFVLPDEREHVIRFADMTPVGATHSPEAPRADVRSILFVIETTHARPGVSGQVWLGDMRLVRE